MINQYIDEVVSKGAEAVLPQNLDEKWLDIIYVAAKNFLHTALTMDGDIPDEEVLSDEGSMMMLSSVVEIVQHQSNYKLGNIAAEIEEEKIFECITCYSLATVLESIARESGMAMTRPDLENIFDRERLFEVEKNHPQLTELLNKLVLEE